MWKGIREKIREAYSNWKRRSEPKYEVEHPKAHGHYSPYVSQVVINDIFKLMEEFSLK